MLPGAYLDSFELFTAAIVWFTLLVPIFLIGILCNFGARPAIIIYVWHTLLCFVMIYVVLDSGGDEIAYYRGALSGVTFQGESIRFGMGTMFIFWFTHVIVNFLEVGFVPTFMIFNFIGSAGVVVFGSVISDLRKAGNIYSPLWVGLVSALPGMSIWTSSIGKDAFSILAIGLFLKGSTLGRRSLPMLGSAVLLMFMVRPHIGIPMAVSAAILMIAQRKFSAIGLVVGGAVLSLVVMFMLPILTQRLGLDELTAQSISAYTIRQGGSVLRRDDAGLWYSQSLPVRWLMTAFYPTILNAGGFMELGVALENIVLMGIFGLLLWRTRLMTRFRREDFHLVVLMLGIWIMLGSLMYNSGLAARQKWMFLPIMLYLALKYANSVRPARDGGSSKRPILPSRRVPLVNPIRGLERAGREAERSATVAGYDAGHRKS